MTWLVVTASSRQEEHDGGMRLRTVLTSLAWSRHVVAPEMIHGGSAPWAISNGSGPLTGFGLLQLYTTNKEFDPKFTTRAYFLLSTRKSSG